MSVDPFASVHQTIHQPKQYAQNIYIGMSKSVNRRVTVIF